jgi:protein-tyrosine-phosphatase/DNA-binding transcriptional ArsR family regulator
MTIDAISADISARERRARIFAALGDPHRLGIVDLLHAQDLSPAALCTALDIPGNLLAHHLRVLQEAGVIERGHSAGDRRRTYVHLIDASFDGLFGGSTIVAPRVVFVCTENSARSILASALWKSCSAVPGASAGTRPARRINPRARAAARRSRLDLVDEAPTPLDRVLRPADLVVTVCDAANEELRLIDQAHLHWSVPDPAGSDDPAAFDTTLEDLATRIGRLSPLVSTTAATSNRTPKRRAPR